MLYAFERDIYMNDTLILEDLLAMLLDVGVVIWVVEGYVWEWVYGHSGIECHDLHVIEA